MSDTQIKLSQRGFEVDCPFWDNHRVKEAPDRKYSPTDKSWVISVNRANAEYIKETYEPAEIDKEAMRKVNELCDTAPTSQIWPEWFKFKNPPMKCQMEALRKSFPMEEFAYIMDMGTGKSFTAINYGAARCMVGDVTAMLVICDTGGKPVWRKEFELHCPIDYDMYIMEAGMHKQAEAWMEKGTGKFKVLVCGVESLSTGPYAKQVAMAFVKKFATYMIIDESSSIKNPTYKKKGRQSRTHVCWDLGAEATCRAILNGTPIDEGVENFFAQFRFLNWAIIGSKNFTLFKNRYCVLGGFEMRKIIGYNDLGSLFKRLKPYVYEVKITDVEDMPDQVYETVYCVPTPEQNKALAELGDPLMVTEQDDLVLQCETVLERMTRYQQIVGGYFPYDLPEDEKQDLKVSDSKHGIVKMTGRNPKMDGLTDTLGKLAHGRKVVIWARFAPERLDIVQHMEDNHPDEYVHMGSGLTADEKYDIMDRFQTDPTIRYFVTSQQIASKAVTLTAATCSIYYSNTFSYSQRLQSERRTWRKGQKHPCLYIDIIMNTKIDKQILEALKKKKSISDYVMEKLAE